MMDQSNKTNKIHLNTKKNALRVTEEVPKRFQRVLTKYFPKPVIIIIMQN